MNTYLVTIERLSHSSHTFEVKAGSVDWASIKAREMAGDHDFGAGSTLEYNVESIQIAPKKN